MAFQLSATGATDPGTTRQNNEDAFLVDGPGGVFVVADGIGGHRAGEVASDLACRFVRDAIAQERAEIDRLMSEPTAEQRAHACAIVERVIQAACAHIHQIGSSDKSKR